MPPANRQIVNPIDLIARVSRRIALNAALGAGLYVIVPALVAIALAAAFAPLAHLTWERAGYAILPARASGLRIGLLIASVMLLLAGAIWALRAYSRANNFVDAAARIDTKVAAKQEVLTLAQFSDPSRRDGRDDPRPALLPVLWRRVMTQLAHFDPDRAFPPEVGAPLVRSSIAALGLLGLIAIALIAMAQPQSPEQLEGRRLHEIAAKLAASTPSAEGRALAGRLDAAAASLENPNLPPKQKLAALAAVTEPPGSEPAGGTGAEQGGTGNGAGNGSGEGGSGNSGTGAANGAGTGEGSGSGSGSGTASSTNGTDKQGEHAEIKNEVAKAEAKIQAESGPNKETGSTPSGGNEKSDVAKAGENPNQPGNQPNPSGPLDSSKPGNIASAEKNGIGTDAKPANGDKGSNLGDTRLGQFPEPAKYERFYKLGDKGIPLDIKDARYVAFRLPQATVVVGSGGKTVLDREQPVASTPYTNVPMKEAPLSDLPDEQQLVPPRYRDLLH